MTVNTESYGIYTTKPRDTRIYKQGRGDLNWILETLKMLKTTIFMFHVHSLFESKDHPGS